MPVTCCLGPFAAKLSARLLINPADVRREWAKLPEVCMNPEGGCTPGGCRANCRDYAAGMVQQLNYQKPDSAPPKAQGRGK